jgi:hypothetical protein
MTLGIKGLITPLSIMTLGLSIELNQECRFTDYRYTECCYAESSYPKCVVSLLLVDISLEPRHK